MAEPTTSELRFETPGPGTWELDPVHFPRPSTRYWSEIHPAAFARGVSDFMAYYGMLLETMEMRYINGFGYRAIIPVADADVPQRFARAEEVWAKKLWRDQLREWDETAKPVAIAAHRELQAVDPDALSDADLAEYLGRCREHHRLMISQHMRYTGAAMLSIGDLLAHVGTWTGVSHSEILGMMRGAAPVSAGASAELERLIAAINADSSARALLDSDQDAGSLLGELRASEGEVGAAAAGYLDLVGYRLLDGFDIGGRYALELPDALVRAIRSAVEGGTGEAAADSDARIADIRAQVPDEHKAEFDEMVDEARLMYRIRDERGVFSDIWASGIARRAVMGAGRRVATRGGVDDPEHFVDADFEEMLALVLGTGGPSANELASRYEWRTTHSAKDAPALLGDPPHPPPDPSGLPPGAGRVMLAMGIALGALFGSSEAEHEEHLLRGLGASGGVYEGPARRVSGPAEFDRIQQGDVLVTESTTEAFNILLPLLGAIVTDSGGLLSHSAIVAREYGIPGVVGTRDATDRIADGTQVRVDGDAGEVTVHGVTAVVPLGEARDEATFGAKAVGLGDAARAGLPVPPGIALSGAIVDEIAASHPDAIAEVLAAARPLNGPLAVRSSAADEDGADASFAGQHLTLLNVPSVDDLASAIREIWWSANSDSAITYRKRVGLFAKPSIGVVVQQLLDPEVAGVMFTRNPINGADERLIEASWGLGEVVVSGRVIPDNFRIDTSGTVLDRNPGVKKIAIRTLPDGGTVEAPIAAEQVEALCLDDDQLAQLHALAGRCEEVYGPARDIEWAIAGNQLYILQCRAVTRAGASPRKPSADDGPAGVIGQVPFFDGLTEKDVTSVAAMFKERRFPAGETITKEGAGAAAFFVIDSGEAEVTLHGRHLATLGRGDYFGETALIDEGARSATVTATTDVVCLGLTYWEFRPLVQHNATIAWNLLQTLARRLRTAQEG